MANQLLLREGDPRIRVVIYDSQSVTCNICQVTSTHYLVSNEDDSKPIVIGTYQCFHMANGDWSDRFQFQS